MPKVYEKIDMHCHTTPRRLSHTVGGDASIDTIRSKMAQFNIKYSLMLATYFPKRGTGISNFRMLRWVERKNFEEFYIPDFIKFLMFGSLDFEHYFKQGFNELEEMADQKLIKGIKIYSGYQNIEHTKLVQVMHLALKYKLPVMFHTGDCINSGGYYADMKEYVYLLSMFPEINFIYSHMCNPLVDKIIPLMLNHKNLFTDMSGLMRSGKEDSEKPEAISRIKRLYETCGMSQLMFGTDFPVQTHADSIYLSEQALSGASESELKDFYFNNAARILGLV